MVTEFELGSRKFKIGKLNTFKQFHIVRRISPILADLLPAIKEVQKFQKKKEEQKTEVEKFDELATILGPVLTGFSKLNDEDSEFVLLGLLSCVEVQGPGNIWAKVSTGTQLMFDDLDLPALLQIGGRVFVANLSGFFAALPQVS